MGKSLLVIDYKTSIYKTINIMLRLKIILRLYALFTKMDVKGLVLYLLEDRVYFKYVHL